jgi:hypothetical protein
MMIEMTTSSSMIVNARRIVYVLSRIFFVIPTEVEESLTISEIFRDVSTSLDMTEGKSSLRGVASKFVVASLE